ncbi:MAG TPA: glutamate synthase-related protein [Sulfolobales archaeon]|nr:glutamate synthase-related protein [Sulfolobales archaeon]
MTIVRSYLAVPRQLGDEFWDIERIDHIRRLAATGKPYKVFVSRKDSMRILDRVRFRFEDAGLFPVENPVADTSTEISGIYMASPIYLGDMSYGALSGNPNIAIAMAADATEVLAGTGEGGLHPEVAKHKRIFIQWASARFGVDISVLMKGLGVVIKIGQGAKPGIGGHLPGSKVTEPISLTRRIPIGSDAISPAPHHDIYSIEDLGQRIEALREATGKPVYVKVAATNYTPYIVSGIARMGADGVIIDGHGAGTGATPLMVRDNVGIPIELAVASANAILERNELRDRFVIIAGGRVSNATDAAKLIALGADVVSIGTGALIAMGCIMIHKCHVGNCPAALTNKIDGTRMLDIEFGYRGLVNFIKGFTLELANILDSLGLKSVRELRGRRDLLVGEGLPKSILEILGIGGFATDPGYRVGDLWSRRRLSYLGELVAKGDPVIIGMGSTGPPDVEKPYRIADWLRIDGAQVTRPSIDPYREDIETGFYLAGGKLYISAPVIFDITDSEGEIRRAIEWASLALGTGLFTDKADEGFEEISISRDWSGIVGWDDLPRIGKYLRIPTSTRILRRIVEIKGILGYVVDEDLGDQDLELVVSELDTILKSAGIRYRYDILAKSSRIRDPGDIVKLIMLGADSVIIPSKILEIAIGSGNRENLKRKAFNLLAGIKKEISLLAGASGVYSLQSTLTGNRELLRAVGLQDPIALRIRVKQAGSL